MSDLTGLPDYLCENCGATDAAAGATECLCCEHEITLRELAAAKAQRDSARECNIALMLELGEVKELLQEVSDRAKLPTVGGHS